MKIHPIYLIPVLILMSALKVNGQKTGSFDETITIQSENRTLSCFVPNNYDSLNQYQLMIALHGLGDESANYRNAIITTLNWHTIFPNTIFICPDGGSDRNSDFYTPAGDEGIIQAAIDFAKSHYSIDASQVILEGFSLGGRSALKYGLDNPSKFKGLLLNTPAIQGIQDAHNNPVLQFGINYANASQIPIFINYGSEDVTYTDVISLTIDSLITNDAILQFEKVAGLAHNLPNSNVITRAKAFFNQNTIPGKEVEVHQVLLNNLQCDSKFNPACIIRNIGTVPITKMELEYEVNGTKQNHIWNGVLNSFDHALINLPEINSGSGVQTIQVRLLSANDSLGDSVLTNNEAVKEVYVSDIANSIPLIESFEQGMEAWTIEETGSLFNWYTDDEVASEGSNSMGGFNTILVFQTLGSEESFRSPTVDLTLSDAPSLAFDVAFNYHKYSPPYATSEVIFADTLIVSVSTDCGQNYSELYKKGGADLATVDSPIMNPLSLQACFFSPTPEQWRTEAINLENYKNSKEAIFKFAYKSGLGGNIYIDRIQFDRALSVPKRKAIGAFTLYPNPAKDQINLHFESQVKRSVKIYSILGIEIDSYDLMGDFSLDINNYPNGHYSIVVLENGERSMRQFVVAK